MTLGLKRGTVDVVDYDPSWVGVFEREKELLGRVLGPALRAIEHVGSTAVPGLASKPIVDLAVAVEEAEPVEAWEALLKPEGYTYFGDRKSRGDRFFAKGPEERRTIYLHVVLVGSANWRNYLSFRNRLRDNDSFRDAYAALKKKLAVEFPQDREAYSRDKADFIEELIGRG
jgi:GrpB-like predicted nucleotidyltransferase (UPF0157 family)